MCGFREGSDLYLWSRFSKGQSTSLFCYNLRSIWLSQIIGTRHVFYELRIHVLSQYMIWIIVHICRSRNKYRCKYVYSIHICPWSKVIKIFARNYDMKNQSQKVSFWLKLSYFTKIFETPDCQLLVFLAWKSYVVRNRPKWGISLHCPLFPDFSRADLCIEKFYIV